MTGLAGEREKAGQGRSRREALVEHLLVLRAQVGDRDALGRLHARYDRRLAGYLAGLLPSSPDAEDVLQEV